MKRTVAYFENRIQTLEGRTTKENQRIINKLRRQLKRAALAEENPLPQ